jgi:hypothetical protein
MDVTVNIRGLAELEARLQELDAIGGQKLVRRVLRKIAKPMADQARSNANSFGQSSGALAQSIGIVSRRPTGQEVAKVSVTSRARNRPAVSVHNAFYGRRRKGIFYGWMVDQGHASGSGKVAGRPWWTPAVNATQGRAVSQFVDEVTKAVRRIEKRREKTANTETVAPA